MLIHLLEMLIATAALCVAAVLAARRLRRPGDLGLDQLLTVAIVLLSEVIVLSLVLGLPGWYRPLPLTLGAVVLALAASRLGPGADRDRAGRTRIGALLRQARRQPLATGAVALAAAALLHRALVAVLVPPSGFDALVYHLLFVGDWVQRGAIGGSDLQRDGCCAWYPVNAEVVYGWLAVFVHSDHLVGLAQVGFLALGGLATVSIARSVGVTDRYAVVAGSLFVLTPIALWQSSTNDVDVALAAGVLMTTAFLLRIVTRPATAGRADVVRFALAAAFTVGIKATALAYVAVACAVLAVHVLLLRRHGARPPWRSLLQAAALVLALVLLGSGWYVRSWAETGNPFWPYRVQALGHVVFAGPRDPGNANPTPPTLAALPAVLHAPRSWAADLDVDLGLRPDHRRLGGLGLVWLLAGLPGAVTAIVLSLRRRDPRFAVLAVAVAPVALLATPDAWWSRFTIPIVAVGVVGYAYTVQRLPPVAARSLTAGAVALSVVGIAETRPLGAFDRLDDRLDGYARALSPLPERARVGVIRGNPMLPYLAMGRGFDRTVTTLRTRPTSAAELTRFLEAHELAYLVSRTPLPERLLQGSGLSQTARSPGAVLYGREGRDP